ncbi:MAG: glycosyltransferase family 2 protein [Dehalococcoidia bacterium]|nr:MAG: glycosyltransferase family 2 protein [Dehalococcoidia bacterium]
MSTQAARPLLSFAMPTYQHGHTLSRALDSILSAPRGAEIEVVVSNNASTDETAAVLHRYVTRYTNVRAEHQPENVTFDENLARAMDGCTGRSIWTMSSDDALVEGALERVLAILESAEGNPILVGNWWIADGDLNPVRIRRAPHPDRLLTTPREAVPVVGLWTLFMSCLVLPADAARTQLFRYRSGDGLTHWKIATRLAACGTPVIEAGAPIVSQRMPDPVDPPYYDVPVVLSRNIRRHLDTLRVEVGLPSPTARATQSRILRVVLRGFVGTALQRWPALGRRWFRPLLKESWSYPAFWAWIAPLYAIPRPMLRSLWTAYRIVRRRASGRTGTFEAAVMRSKTRE